MDKLPVDRAGCERLLMGTDEITILAGCDETGGALFAVEIRMHPGGGPPVMHRHRPGEIYHVLDGEFTFYTDEGAAGVRRVTATAGEVVPLAGGVPHTIRNESDRDAVAFVVHAPGAPMEQFGRAVAAVAAAGPPDMATVLEIAARNGIELLGPVPAHRSEP
jgi:mannose-6-phosphate isomerase-like protein (cupin superfamily)